MRCLYTIMGIVICLIHSSNLDANPSYISIRSPSVDSARDLVGWTDKVNLWDMECLYITGGITLEGTRSFDSDALASCLLGATNPSTLAPDESIIRVSGSGVPNRGPRDWLADYFFLPSTFQSTLFFEPRVSNLILDFSFYIGLDEWVRGLYFRAHAPLVVTRWDLNFRELQDRSLPLEGYPAGYFTPSPIAANQLVSTAADYLSDRDIPSLPNGITTEPLEFARLEQARLHKTALSEIQLALGYNFILCPNYHFGFNFRAYAPTGNRPKAVFAFEPIVGNGKHWEVGAGYTFGYTLWRSCDCESSFGFYSDGNFTHMLSTHQTRTFDLRGKPLSRYMLAERLGAPENPPTLFANPMQGVATTGSTVPVAQFKGAYAPVANLTTLKVNVKAAIQIDITGLFNYSSCGLSVDVGYNFWYRSCEKISLRDDLGPTRLQSGNVWALKGDAFVYGFVASDAVIPPPPPNFSADQAVALSATQSQATIFSGTNAAVGGNQNPNIDNREFAVFSTFDDSDQLVAAPGNPGGPAFQQATSNDPIFLSNLDLDLSGTKGLSHKIFAHLSYTWCDCDGVMPYIGVGGKAEFGPRSDRKVLCDCDTTACTINSLAPSANCSNCKNCCRCNLSEWGVWVKGGIFFN